MAQDVGQRRGLKKNCNFDAAKAGHVRSGKLIVFFLKPYMELTQNNDHKTIEESQLCCFPSQWQRFRLFFKVDMRTDMLCTNCHLRKCLGTQMVGHVVK